MAGRMDDLTIELHIAGQYAGHRWYNLAIGSQTVCHPLDAWDNDNRGEARDDQVQDICK